jgi:uncharacterized protein (TIGR03437 family)
VIPSLLLLLIAQAPASRIPRVFEPNNGQAAESVRFVSRSAQGNLLLTAGEAILAIHPPPPSLEEALDPDRWRRASSERRVPEFLRMRLSGALPEPAIEGMDRLPGETVYSDGIVAPHFSGVRYRGVYPGVDLVFRAGEREALEHDFVVAPGADPSRIRIRFEGATDITIDPEGDLVLTLENSVVRHRRPVIYQEEAGARRLVNGDFRISGDGEVTFGIGDYDAGRTLIIDPIINFTRFGTSAGDFMSSAASTPNGIVACGAVASLDFPAGYPNPGGSYGGGLFDAFVLFMDTGLTAVRRLHIIRGNADDRCFRVAVRPGGGAYAGGVTQSTNLVGTPGAAQAANGGMTDMWIAGYDADASQQFFTHLGDTADDVLFTLITDPDGNGYAGGWTLSAGYPTTAGSYNQAALGGADGVVSRISPTGRLLQSTRLGSNGNDIVTRLALAHDGSVGFTGSTTGTNLPTNANAPQRAREGTQDAMVGALAADLSRLFQMTYLGGGNVDTGRALTINPNPTGGFYYTVAGTTNSPTGFGGQYGGGIDGFGTGISWPFQAAAETVWSRYFGGPGDDNIFALTERRGAGDWPIVHAFYGNTTSTLANTATGAPARTARVEAGASGLNPCTGTPAQAWVARFAPGTGELEQGCLGPGTIDDASQKNRGRVYSSDIAAASIDPETTLPSAPDAFDVTPNGGRDGALVNFKSPARVLPLEGAVQVTQLSHASKAFSGTGSVHVNVRRLLEQLGLPRGYFHMVSSAGWVVRNILLDSQHEIAWLNKHFLLDSTIQSDNPAPGTRIATVRANIAVTPDPLLAAPPFNSATATVLPVGQESVATCGAGAPGDGVPPPPENPPFSSTGRTYSYVQPYSALNIHAAHNQCVPVAFANSLAWLDASHHDFNLPNRHEAGFMDDTLVGTLERRMGRTASSKSNGQGVGFDDAMRGKFEYLDQNRLTRMLVHKHQGQGAGSDFSAFGQISRSEGSRLTFEWLCGQIEAGEDVEILYEVPPSNPRVPFRSSHMVRVIGCGETRGAQWIQIIQDAKQGNIDPNNLAGLEVKHVWLHDFDGDGNLNNDSPLTEVLLAHAESFTDEMKQAVGASPLTVRRAVVNGGSYQPVAVAPGSFAAIFGLFNYLSSVLTQKAPGRQVVEIPGVRVLINGRAAPILSAASSQLNVQVPVETETGEATLVIEYNGLRSNAIGIPVQGASPGIFVIDPSIAGPGRGAVQNQDFSLNLPGSPTVPGSFITVYVAGLGRMNPAQRTGVAAPAGELVRAVGNVTARIGGRDATVQFAGLTPGFLALEQVNVQAPDLPPGEYELEISVDGVASNRVTISIGAR